MTVLRTRMEMPEMLRAELFHRKPFVNLFPSRVRSNRLMQHTPGEFPAERFSKARSGCTAVEPVRDERGGFWSQNLQADEKKW